MGQISTKVRTDELSLLISGIRRALSLHDGELVIKVYDQTLQLESKNTGEVCQIKLSDNVVVGED